MIDQRGFRDVLGQYPTGVVVVTGTDPDDSPVGMVVGTFSAVSLEPQLVSFMPTRLSSTYSMLKGSDGFCVNVLAHDQRLVCQTLATKDTHKFDGVEWERSEFGLPLINGAVAYIHCRLVSEIVAGDHFIVLCEVFAVEVARSVTPLLFFQGGYGGFSSSGMTPNVDSSLIAAVRVAEVARPQLESLAAQFDSSVEAIVQVNDHDQTIGASAYGDTARVDERLGVRIPLVPPLGEVAVAWSPEHADRWLDRVPSGASPDVDQYRNQLERVRAAGYGIALVAEDDQDEYNQMLRAISEYATGALTPARDRAVRAQIASGARYFCDDRRAAQTGANVVSLVVPVFDPTAPGLANSGLTIRMGGLPPGMSDPAISTAVAAMVDAAAEVSRALAGTAKKEFDRYVLSGLRMLP